MAQWPPMREFIIVVQKLMLDAETAEVLPPNVWGAVWKKTILSDLFCACILVREYILSDIQTDKLC